MTLHSLPAYFREVAKLRARPQRLASLAAPMPGVELSWLDHDQSNTPFSLAIRSEAGRMYRRAHIALRHQRLFALGIGRWENESLLLLELAATLDLDTGRLLFEFNPSALPALHPAALLTHGALGDALVRELTEASIDSAEAALRIVQRISVLLGIESTNPETDSAADRLAPTLWLLRSGDPELLRAWHAIALQSAQGDALGPPLRSVSSSPVRATSAWLAPPLEDSAAKLGQMLAEGAAGITVYAGAGCGKTTTGANLVLDALEQGKRVLVCAGNPAAVDIFRQRLHPSCAAIALRLPDRERDGATHAVKGNLRQLAQAMAPTASDPETGILDPATALWERATKQIQESVRRDIPPEEGALIAQHLRIAPAHRWLARYVRTTLDPETVMQVQLELRDALPRLAEVAPVQRVLARLHLSLPAPRVVAAWAEGLAGSACPKSAEKAVPPSWQINTFRTLLRQRAALRRSAVTNELLAAIEARGQTPGMLRGAVSTLREVVDLGPGWQHPSLRNWLDLKQDRLLSTLEATCLLNRCKANGAAFLDYALNPRLRAAWQTLTRAVWTCSHNPWPNPARVEPFVRAALGRSSSYSRLEPVLGSALAERALADPGLAMRLSAALRLLSAQNVPLPMSGTAESARQQWLADCERQLAVLRWQARDTRIRNLRNELETMGDEPLAHALSRALEDTNLPVYQTLFNHVEGIRRGRITAVPTVLSGHLPDLLEALRLHGDAPLWRTRAAAFESAHAWLVQHRLLRAARQQQRRAAGATRAVVDACHEQRQRGLSTCAKATHRERFQRVGRHHLAAWGKAVERIGKGTGRHASLHRQDAIRHLHAALPALPLVLATPNGLAQHLDDPRPTFDLLVIDEATQLGAETAYLLHLAEQAVIIGDDAQLATPQIGVSRTPQQLLRRLLLQEHPFADALTAANSLFDVAEVAFADQLVLRKHFRCHPDILGFSNATSYSDSPLRPMRQEADRPLGPPLEWVRVASAPSAEDGLKREVESIVERVIDIAADPFFNNRSIAVISLRGPAQAQAIEALLRRRLAPEAWERHHLRIGLAYHFQGSEYDVAILSLALDPASPAKALTRDDDRRRLNVAMTRARHKVILFSSVSPEALRPGCLRRQLLEHLSAHCGPSHDSEPWTALPLKALPTLATYTSHREHRGQAAAMYTAAPAAS